MLNMTYEPLCVVGTKRAITLVIDNKAETLHHTGQVFRSQHLVMPEPSVIRLAYYIKVPYQRKISLSRRAIFLRDGGKCQYCGAPAENIDHVYPKSRGGPHAWENVVASCKRCNSKKEDRLPEEVGLKLKHLPFRPKEKIWILARASVIRGEWTQYLGVKPATLAAAGRIDVSENAGPSNIINLKSIATQDDSGQDQHGSIELALTSSK